MKTKTVILGLAASLCLGVFHTRANLEVSAGVQINATADFYAPLAPQGAWVDVHSYGRCWHPAHVAVDWRPYCMGEWVWTDCGWYWQSDEPWGWACYHYGSWAYDSSIGWVWVPGVEWAPAWVTWRTGGGYIGWAPCAPHGVVIAPDFFAFVAIGHFNDPIRPSGVIVRNQELIRKTTVINDVRRETRNFDGQARRVVINEGPGVAPIQKATGRQIKAVPVSEVTRQTRYPDSIMHKSATPAKSGESAIPPAREVPPRNEVAPSTRGYNPAPPSNERPSRKEEVVPPSRGVSPSPAPAERAPRKPEVAPSQQPPAKVEPSHERPAEPPRSEGRDEGKGHDKP